MYGVSRDLGVYVLAKVKIKRLKLGESVILYELKQIECVLSTAISLMLKTPTVLKLR